MMTVGTFTINNPKYLCPIHGVTEHDFTSSIPGNEGIWCLRCLVEAFDRIGVQRITKIEEEKSNGS